MVDTTLSPDQCFTCMLNALYVCVIKFEFFDFLNCYDTFCKL